MKLLMRTVAGLLTVACLPCSLAATTSNNVTAANVTDTAAELVPGSLVMTKDNAFQAPDIFGSQKFTLRTDPATGQVDFDTRTVDISVKTKEQDRVEREKVAIVNKDLKSRIQVADKEELLATPTTQEPPAISSPETPEKMSLVKEDIESRVAPDEDKRYRAEPDDYPMTKRADVDYYEEEEQARTPLRQPPAAPKEEESFFSIFESLFGGEEEQKKPEVKQGGYHIREDIQNMKDVLNPQRKQDVVGVPQPYNPEYRIQTRPMYGPGQNYYQKPDRYHAVQRPRPRPQPTPGYDDYDLEEFMDRNDTPPPRPVTTTTTTERPPPPVPQPKPQQPDIRNEIENEEKKKFERPTSPPTRPPTTTTTTTTTPSTTTTTKKFFPTPDDNEIKPSSIHESANFYNFINLPVHYSTKDTAIPLISTSYANTKVQGLGASKYDKQGGKYPNHKYDAATSTKRPNYWQRRTTSARPPVSSSGTPKPPRPSVDVGNVDYDSMAIGAGADFGFGGYGHKQGVEVKTTPVVTTTTTERTTTTFRPTTRRQEVTQRRTTARPVTTREPFEDYEEESYPAQVYPVKPWKTDVTESKPETTTPEVKTTPSAKPTTESAEYEYYEYDGEPTTTTTQKYRVKYPSLPKDKIQTASEKVAVVVPVKTQAVTEERQTTTSTTTTTTEAPRTTVQHTTRPAQEPDRLPTRTQAPEVIHTRPTTQQQPDFFHGWTQTTKDPDSFLGRPEKESEIFSGWVLDPEMHLKEPDGFKRPSAKEPAPVFEEEDEAELEQEPTTQRIKPIIVTAETESEENVNIVLVPAKPEPKPEHRPERPDQRPESPEPRPDRPEYRPERPEHRPDRPEHKPELRPVQRPEHRPELRPEHRPENPEPPLRSESEEEPRPDGLPPKFHHHPAKPHHPHHGGHFGHHPHRPQEDHTTEFTVGVVQGHPGYQSHQPQQGQPPHGGEMQVQGHFVATSMSASPFGADDEPFRPIARPPGMSASFQVVGDDSEVEQQEPSGGPAPGAVDKRPPVLGPLPLPPHLKESEPVHEPHQFVPSPQFHRPAEPDKPKPQEESPDYDFAGIQTEPKPGQYVIFSKPQLNPEMNENQIKKKPVIREGLGQHAEEPVFGKPQGHHPKPYYEKKPEIELVPNEKPSRPKGTQTEKPFEGGFPTKEPPRPESAANYPRPHWEKNGMPPFLLGGGKNDFRQPGIPPQLVPNLIPPGSGLPPRFRKPVPPNMPPIRKNFNEAPPHIPKTSLPNILPQFRPNAKIGGPHQRPYHRPQGYQNRRTGGGPPPHRYPDKDVNFPYHIQGEKEPVLHRDFEMQPGTDEIVPKFITHRGKLPNEILEQYAAQKRRGEGPMNVQTVRDALQPPDPKILRRLQRTPVTTLQMLKQKPGVKPHRIPVTREDNADPSSPLVPPVYKTYKDDEKNLFVVYPSNAKTQPHFKTDTKPNVQIEDPDKFPLNFNSNQDQVPLLKPTKKVEKLPRPDFPYGFVRPDDKLKLVRKDPVTERAEELPGDKEIKPNLQDYMPYVTKKPVPSSESGNDRIDMNIHLQSNNQWNMVDDVITQRPAEAGGLVASGEPFKITDYPLGTTQRYRTDEDVHVDLPSIYHTSLKDSDSSAFTLGAVMHTVPAGEGAQKKGQVLNAEHELVMPNLNVNERISNGKIVQVSMPLDVKEEPKEEPRNPPAPPLPNSMNEKYDFQAPFQASSSVHEAQPTNQGWSIVQEGHDPEVEDRHVPEATNTTFNIENFQPELQGGFKPIYEDPEEETKTETQTEEIRDRGERGV